MDNVPLLDIDEDDITDLDIYQQLEESVNNDVADIRNPELANGRRVRQQIVESLFNTQNN